MALQQFVHPFMWTNGGCNSTFNRIFLETVLRSLFESLLLNTFSKRLPGNPGWKRKHARFFLGTQYDDLSEL